MRIDKGAWVLVADGERFMLYRNAGQPMQIELERVTDGAIENPPTREQGTDRPGRFDDVGPGRSTAEQTDYHRLEKERFAKDLAERLRGWALDGRFEALVLVADPRTLGVLRPELHKAVKERLVAEIDKDLTSLSTRDIEGALAAA